jgi:hypothetical protein
MQFYGSSDIPILNVLSIHVEEKNMMDTSLAALESLDTASLRELVFKMIEEMGCEGATCDEVEMALDMKHQTASARITELKKMGRIVALGAEWGRPTRSGRNARVHVTKKEFESRWDLYEEFCEPGEHEPDLPRLLRNRSYDKCVKCGKILKSGI